MHQNWDVNSSSSCLPRRTIHPSCGICARNQVLTMIAIAQRREFTVIRRDQSVTTKYLRIRMGDKKGVNQTSETALKNDSLRQKHSLNRTKKAASHHQRSSRWVPLATQPTTMGFLCWVFNPANAAAAEEADIVSCVAHSRSIDAATITSRCAMQCGAVILMS